MNYRYVYMKIIKNAKNEEIIGKRKRHNGEYYEAHHILPKSLFPLWRNRKSNVVLLTAREHFFVHQLLAKIYTCNKMFFAIHAFVSRPNADYKITSREYERIKKDFVVRIRPIARKANLGRKLSPEAIEKIKIARARQTLEGRTNKGTHWSEESRKKFSEIVKAAMTDERKNLIKTKTREACAKKVRNIETGRCFDCISDVKLWLGQNVQVANIIGAIKGRKNYAYKDPVTKMPLHWEYIED